MSEKAKRCRRVLHTDDESCANPTEMKMPRYYVINESTEDILESTDSLKGATRVAREGASQAQPGDLVSILESGGRAIVQFVLMPDGKWQKLKLLASSRM